MPLVGKDDRHAAIRELLKPGTVRSQDEIAHALSARGFDVGQSSISRDLRELAVIKIKGRYVIPAARPAEPAIPAGSPRDVALDAVVRASVTGLHRAGPHLLVIHTVAGSASAVGLAVDQGRWPEVIGTVAGDDTLFVATDNRRDQTSVMQRFQRMKEGIAIHA